MVKIERLNWRSDGDSNEWHGDDVELEEGVSAAVGHYFFGGW